MSLILGAIGGAGEQMANIAQQNQKTSDAQDMAQLEFQLATHRAETLEQFKTTLATTTANQQREKMVGDINGAVPDILNNGIVGRAAAARAQQLPAYDPSDTTGPASFHGNASSALDAINSMADGPDKQAALAQLQQQVGSGKAQNANLSIGDLTDEEKARFAPTDSDRDKARTRAAIEKGYISPTDAMKTSSSQEITQLKMQSLLDRADDKNATLKEIGDVRADALKYGYELRLKAAEERAANGKVDTATTRMLITSEDANIRASTSQLGMLNQQLEYTPQTVGGKPNPQFATLTQQMDELRSDIAQSKKNKVALFQSLGLMPDTTPAPAAPSAPAAGPKDYSALWKDKPRPPLSFFLSGEPAKPATQADFDALRSGAMFVNPADGKTYTKK
jgi:hypothetical protein